MTDKDDEARRIGLCASCVHARRVESDRGKVSGSALANLERKSVFWLCKLSATDARFPKYPRLPVIECGGYATSAANRQDANRERTQPLTAAEVLRRYTEEELPEFIGVVLKDVNQPGTSGDRPLHVASIRGDLEEIAALLDGGADINARGDLGNTPLHAAAGQGHVAVVRLLLVHGATSSLRNEFGDTALDIAESYAREEIARLLAP